MSEYIVALRHKGTTAISVDHFKTAISKIEKQSGNKVNVKDVHQNIGSYDIVARVEANDQAVSPFFQLGEVHTAILDADKYVGKPFTATDAATFDSVGNTQVNDLEITITTGGDDCRGDSVVVAAVVFGQNQTFSTTVHPQNGPWGNNTTNGPFTLICGPPWGPLNRLREFYIQFSSHPNFIETGDNWNMESVRVTYELAGGVSGILVNMSGDPLYRFTTAGTWYAPISLPG